MSVELNLPDTGKQDDVWSCGPNSGARVLAYWGHNVNYGTVRSAGRRIGGLWCDIGIGLAPHELRDLMKKWEGQNVRLVRGQGNFNQIKTLLNQGKPVIVLLRVGSCKPLGFLSGTWPKLHWVVVDGYCDSLNLIYYTDTNSQRYQISYSDFQDQWNWRVGPGAASEFLYHSGVKGKTILWIDR